VASEARRAPVITPRRGSCSADGRPWREPRPVVVLREPKTIATAGARFARDVAPCPGDCADLRASPGRRWRPGSCGPVHGRGRA
jgi:hypothetical protein